MSFHEKHFKLNYVTLIVWFVHVYEQQATSCKRVVIVVHTDEPYNKLLIALLAPCASPGI